MQKFTIWRYFLPHITGYPIPITIFNVDFLVSTQFLLKVLSMFLLIPICPCIVITYKFLYKESLYSEITGVRPSTNHHRAVEKKAKHDRKPPKSLATRHSRDYLLLDKTVPIF